MADDSSRWNADAQRWESAAPPLPHTPPPPGAPPVPYAPFRFSRNVVVALAAAAVVGASGTTAAIMLGRDGDGSGKVTASPTEERATPTERGPTGAEGPASGGGEGPAGDPSSPGVPSTSPSDPSDDAKPSDSPPSGYRLAEDPQGFTLAVPGDWERTRNKNGVFYRAADGRSLLQIFAVGDHGPTTLEQARQSSTAIKGNPGYREERIGSVDSGAENPSGDAVELVYSYDNKEVGSRRLCVERFFTATDHQQYAVLAAAPAGDISVQRTLLDTALAHFEPGWN
ncbi:hypothetical protein [Streptomyces corynorhini]|uniref:Serine/arginine repetitive matrix protein 2 n=1 Tax=Streptomyces corynorhini TaxID=2282652 RepID=A0A370B6T3_9ACTN|nr:hypothetical protein [Streptomyces corynorhini]RDG35804.1 hypothetical protein DVH02_23360 [Streptomyces corynorhini]